MTCAWPFAAAGRSGRSCKKWTRIRRGAKCAATFTPTRTPIGPPKPKAQDAKARRSGAMLTIGLHQPQANGLELGLEVELGLVAGLDVQDCGHVTGLLETRAVADEQIEPEG